MPAVSRTIQIAASPRTVWELLSSQEGLQAWLEPGMKIDMKVGGQYRFHVPEFDEYISGYVMEMEPEKRLVLSWYEEGSDWKFALRLSFTLDAVEGGTLVTHQYDGFAGLGKANWMGTMNAYDRGMDAHQILANLKKAVETRNVA